VAVALIFVAVGSIETYTANRRHEEFFQPTGPIREGMTEAARQGRVGVVREEDCEETRRHRKPGMWVVFVKLDVSLLVKCRSRTVTL
jgi:hypothetical protein